MIPKGAFHLPRLVCIGAYSCILTGTLLTAQPNGSSEGASPTFALTLSSQAPQYRVGSNMWMTITQTNLTNHKVDCTETWTGIDVTYQYEAVDEDGKPAEKVSRGTSAGDVHPCTMRTGEKVQRSVLINRIFKLDRPGKYVIRVSRQESDLTDNDGNPVVVWSNPVTITITG